MLVRTLVGVGIAIMIYAAARCKQYLNLVPEADLRRYWKALGILIVLFISGYLFFEYALFADFKLNNERLIISFVLFLGSVHVLLVTTLGYRAFSEILELQRKTQNYAEHLEDEVCKRTQALEELSITDNLTGLYNQRYLFPRLEEEITRASRQNRTLFVVLFDIDKFKAINDREGHLAGDQVLRDVGDAIRRNVRGSVDCGFRYGGDEFTILLSDINKAQALRVVKRIMDQLAEHNVYISAGIVPHASHFILDANGLLSVADQAMYEAKAEGGNTVRFMRPIATPESRLRLI